MSSMYDKLEGLAQAAGTQAGAAADGDALIGRVRRTRSAFRFGSAGVVGLAGVGLLVGGVAFANSASSGLADNVSPGASTSPSASSSPSVTPSASPTTEPSEGVEPSTEPSTEPSPDPTWSTAPGSGKGDDGNEVDDQGGDADHQAGGDDGHDGTDDSHHGDGGSPSPSPEPSETSGDHHRG